jgi:hypothetical protein
MTSVRKLPIALAVALLAGQAAPAAGAEGLEEEVTRLRHAIEQLGQSTERPRLHPTEPAEAEPPIKAECDGIGQARQPRMGMSLAVVLAPREPVAPVLRFDAMPGMETSEQVAGCLYMPLAGVGR